MSQLGSSLPEVQWLERSTGVQKGMGSTPVTRTEISFIFHQVHVQTGVVKRFQHFHTAVLNEANTKSREHLTKA